MPRGRGWPRSSRAPTPASTRAATTARSAGSWRCPMPQPCASTWPTRWRPRSTCWPAPSRTTRACMSIASRCCRKTGSARPWPNARRRCSCPRPKRRGCRGRRAPRASPCGSARSASSSAPNPAAWCRRTNAGRTMCNCSSSRSTRRPSAGRVMPSSSATVATTMRSGGPAKAGPGCRPNRDVRRAMSSRCDRACWCTGRGRCSASAPRRPPCMSAATRPWPGAAGPAAGCRPSPNGNWPLAAARRAVLSGAMSSNGPAAARAPGPAAATRCRDSSRCRSPGAAACCAARRG